MRLHLIALIDRNFVPLNPWFVVSRSRGVLVVCHFIGESDNEIKISLLDFDDKVVNKQAASAQKQRATDADGC